LVAHRELAALLIQVSFHLKARVVDHGYVHSLAPHLVILELPSALIDVEAAGKHFDRSLDPVSELHLLLTRIPHNLNVGQRRK
jgi:hypothetical protein